MKPKVVTSTDEADLAKQLQKLEEENAEVCLYWIRNAIFLNIYNKREAKENFQHLQILISFLNID